MTLFQNSFLAGELKMSCDLWTSLLRESSKRSKYHNDSICIFLGDSDCGKTKLIDTLCTNNNVKDSSANEYVSKEILSYNYFDIEDNSSLDIPSKLGIWSISDKCFNHALETVVNPTKTNKVKYKLINFFYYLFTTPSSSSYLDLVYDWHRLD